MPGVRAVLTAADIPHNVIAEEASGGLADSTVVHAGAGVRPRPLRRRAGRGRRGRDPQAADEAAELVVVDYEEEPGVFDVEAALRRRRAASCTTDGNRYVDLALAIGDVDGGDRARRRRRRGDLPDPARRPRLPRARGRDRLDRRRRRADAARLDAGDRALRASSRASSRCRTSRVRVIAAYMGGGFGGKEDMTVEPYLALLVWQTRRPVRMVWTARSRCSARQKRHPFTMRYRTGATRDGTHRRAGDLDRRRRRRVPAALLARAVRRRRQLDRPVPRRGRARRQRRACSRTPCRRARCAASARCRSCSPTSRRWIGSPQAPGLDPAELRERNFVEPGRPARDRRDDRHRRGRRRVHAPGAGASSASRRRRPRPARCRARGRLQHAARTAARCSSPTGRRAGSARAGRHAAGPRRRDRPRRRSGRVAGQIAGEILGVTIDRIERAHRRHGADAADRRHVRHAAAVHVRQRGAEGARELRDRTRAGRRRPARRAARRARVRRQPGRRRRGRGGGGALERDGGGGACRRGLAVAAARCPTATDTFHAEIGEFDPRTGQGARSPTTRTARMPRRSRSTPRPGEVRVLQYVGLPRRRPRDRPAARRGADPGRGRAGRRLRAERGDRARRRRVTRRCSPTT